MLNIFIQLKFFVARLISLTGIFLIPTPAPPNNEEEKTISALPVNLITYICKYQYYWSNSFIDFENFSRFLLLLQIWILIFITSISVILVRIKPTDICSYTDCRINDLSTFLCVRMVDLWRVGTYNWFVKIIIDNNKQYVRVYPSPNRNLRPNGILVIILVITHRISWIVIQEMKYALVTTLLVSHSEVNNVASRNVIQEMTTR